MDPDLHHLMASGADSDEDSTNNVATAPVPGAGVISITLSLTNLLHPSKPNALTAPPPTSLRIPTQLSSLTRLSLHPTPAAAAAAAARSSLAAAPLQSPLLGRPRPSPDPSHPFALRRASIVWFRNDLRVQDHEVLDAAHRDSLSLLPLYCFDPRDYGKSSAGFDKTGPYRAAFLLQSVADLRKSLRARGSDLVVRVGRPEAVLAEMAKAVGAEAVYAHREVSHDEVRAEERVEKAMEEEGVEVKYFWGSTLYHIDDLPFKLEDMPSNYGGFRERVQRLSVRKAIKAVDQLKKLPAKGGVEVGEIPTLVDLGLSPTPTLTQVLWFCIASFYVFFLCGTAIWCSSWL